MAIKADLQHPNQTSAEAYKKAATSSESWHVYPTAGGNGYWHIDTDYSSDWAFIRNRVPYSMTYAGCSQIQSSPGGPGGWLRLYDAANNTLTTTDTLSGIAYKRVEVVITGTTANFYVNGVLVNTKTGVTQNPTYIGFGAATLAAESRWDNCVWGDVDTRYVISMPTVEWYYLKKDMINPAGYGFFYANNDTLISSTTFPIYWSRSSPNLTGGPANESIDLINIDDGTVYNRYYTGSSMTGSLNVEFYNALVVADAPYGLYAVKINTTTSDPILYKASGATVAFDKPQYSQGDTASVSWEVATGGYWDTSQYDYIVGIQDAYGNWLKQYPLTERTGTFEYEFTQSDEQGVYLAAVIATSKSTGDEYWLSVDYAELDAYTSFDGFVYDAETELPIDGANVLMTQDLVEESYTTGVSGGYSNTGFSSGAPIIVNVTKTGYRQYLVTITPHATGTIELNFTLIPESPTYSFGLGLGGVARDGYSSDGYTITKGYGRPQAGVTVWVNNTSTAESYQTTTNSVGYYLCDLGASCTFVQNRTYDVVGSKLGYANSPIYNVTISGSVVT